MIKITCSIKMLGIIYLFLLITTGMYLEHAKFHYPLSCRNLEHDMMIKHSVQITRHSSG